MLKRPLTDTGVNSAAPTTQSQPTASPGLFDYGLLIALGAIWGASFMLIKVGVDTMPAWSMTTVRLGIAAAFMAGWAAFQRQGMPRTAGFWLLALMTALVGNVVPFMLIAWGEQHIDSGIAAICIATMPLMTLLLAHFTIPDDRLTVPKFIGVSCGIAGLIVLVGPEKLLGLGTGTIRLLAVVAAALCYALNAIVTRKLLRDEPRYALAAAVMGLAVLMITPVALWLDRAWIGQLSSGGQWPSTRSLLAVLLLGVLQTGVAQILLFIIIGRRGASFFAQVNYFVPVFGVLWGWLVLSEQLPARAFLALAVILFGLFVVRLWGNSAPVQPVKFAASGPDKLYAAHRKKRRKH
jgi:drug/metabolite transporter (DMT)-like permease